MNYGELNNIARKNGVILMGGSFDKAIPVTELAQSFEFNFELYNRSEDKLSIAAAKIFSGDLGNLITFTWVDFYDYVYRGLIPLTAYLFLVLLQDRYSIPLEPPPSL